MAGTDHKARHRVTAMTRSRRSGGFTLIEMLIVIAVIGLLIGLLMPAIQAAREAARRASCANNLKQLGVALQNYYEQHNAFPPGSPLLPKPIDSVSGTSWRVWVLPFIEETTLYDRIHPATDGTAANWTARTQTIDLLRCPSAQPSSSDPSSYKISFYSGVGGAGTTLGRRIGKASNQCGDVSTDGIFYPNSNTRISQIVDGTSHTLAIGERTYYLDDWMSGAYWVTSPTSQICGAATKNVRYPINADLNQFGYFFGDPNAPASAASLPRMTYNDLFFGSYHPGGAQFCYADGHVAMLPDATEFTLLQSLSTVAGGEPTDGQP